MLFLYAFGTSIENKLGRVRFLVLYFGAGFTGSLFFSLYPNTTLPVIGSSGAISGLLAAYLIIYPKAKFLSLWIILWMVSFIFVPAWIYISFWILEQLASFALVRNADIAYQSHIGGIVFGILFAIYYKLRYNR